MTVPGAELCVPHLGWEVSVNLHCYESDKCKWLLKHIRECVLTQVPHSCDHAQGEEGPSSDWEKQQELVYL